MQNCRTRSCVFRVRCRAGPSAHVVPSLPSVPSIPHSRPTWKLHGRSERRHAYVNSVLPNRAGNSLCSWHDTRRERRIHPPRMAPDGFLNCGCTSEEALFEESLARNGVGSYHPGDSVRMDPHPTKCPAETVEVSVRLSRRRLRN